MGSETPPAENLFAELRSQLEEIQRLRALYEVDLGTLGKPASVIANSVFMSSTCNDLKAYRQAVRESIEYLLLKLIGMKEFSPSGQTPAELIRDKVNEAEVYLGILGLRYGYMDLPVDYL